MNNASKLRKILKKNKILTLPGVYDCLSAKIAERSGFKSLFTSGFGIAATSFGEPDYGLVTATEMLEGIRRINATIDVPLVADIDTGYGNPLNVIRTVNEIINFGIAGVIIEDQLWPKRCGHMDGKEVISINDQVEKIKAAKYASKDSDLVIVARTDARAVLGINEALDRGYAYIEAGADVLFIEAPESINEMKLIAKEFPNTYLFANMVEGGKTPYISPKELENIGFKIVVYPVFGLFASAYALTKSYDHLFKNHTSEGFSNLVDFKMFEDIIDLKQYKKLENKFC